MTSRGAKHIEELIKASKKGYEVYIAFVIQREDCNQFAIASDIDPEYSELLSEAVKTVSYTHLTLPTNREV